MSTIPPVGSVPDVVTNTVIASDWGNAVGSASRGRVVHRFNTTTERDSSITVPVTGMICYVAATNTFYGYRNPGGWSGFLGGPRDANLAVMGRAAALTIGAVDTSIPWDTTISDGSAMWSAAQVGFVVPVAGLYLVSFTILVAIVATQNASLKIYQAGAPARSINFVSPAVTAVSTMSLAATLKCTAGQLVQTVGNIPGGRGDITPGTLTNYASVSYLGTG